MKPDRDALLLEALANLTLAASVYRGAREAERKFLAGRRLDEALAEAVLVLDGVGGTGGCGGEGPARYSGSSVGPRADANRPLGEAPSNPREISRNGLDSTTQAGIKPGHPLVTPDADELPARTLTTEPAPVEGHAAGSGAPAERYITQQCGQAYHRMCNGGSTNRPCACGCHEDQRQSERC